MDSITGQREVFLKDSLNQGCVVDRGCGNEGQAAAINTKENGSAIKRKDTVCLHGLKAIFTKEIM